ncbi:MAG: chemotaxis protein [Anaeromicrobium sp.]|jgi:two-component system chemotaxis response regulator CheV|uniref:chemotaxis protein n=1 Tax=Anaeromicrobium sp. TaxID=1929132 RepID=UPI0025EB8B92|nr:chemotaxis protein [Anaeromicrobium sp.]MCT4594003.1 chemotaxis protein [Anaeromicrobium sp.]
MSGQTGILLESGTGEVEVLEFVVGQKHYAINVIKTKEIFEVDNITKIPNSNNAVAGMTLIRGNVLTVIDFKYVLEKQKNPDVKRSMALLCEFNKTKVAFLVDKVIGIHRIGWDNIEKPNGIVQDSLVIGNIIIDDKILMLLDFEKVVMDIKQSYGAYEKGIKNIKYNRERSDVRLILADDSITIRTMLNDVLREAGYTNLTFFDDGKQALDYLNSMVDKNGTEFLESVGALITDIEMPQMDGHTLTRKVKEHSILKDLPVIIFSSLITNDLHHKGESVGADAQMSKPQIDDLVEVIDKYTL